MRPLIWIVWVACSAPSCWPSARADEPVTSVFVGDTDFYDGGEHEASHHALSARLLLSFLNLGLADPVLGKLVALAADENVSERPFQIFANGIEAPALISFQKRFLICSRQFHDESQIWTHYPEHTVPDNSLILC